MSKLHELQLPETLSEVQISLPPVTEGRWSGIPKIQEQPMALPVYNLLNNLARLGQLLDHELRHGSCLNSYLLAVGMLQIVEDYLQPDPFLLFTVEKYLAKIPRPIGLIAAKSDRLTGDAILRVRSGLPKIRRLIKWRTDMTALVQQLADRAVDFDTVGMASPQGSIQLGESLLASLTKFPIEVLQQIIKLPACFRSFDQQPADLDRMTDEFAARWPDRDRPLVALGIRTSGSYLAPLCAAFLKRQGFDDVQAMTMRPGRDLSPSDRRILQAVVRQNGLVMVADDPPVTGKSYVAVIEQLERVGVPAESIVLMVPLSGSRDALPPLLHKFQTVILEWKEWAIHQQLAPIAVKQAMTDLLGPTIDIGDVEPLPTYIRASGRGHSHALFKMQMIDRNSGYHWEQEVAVKSVGLGYLGEFALAVAQGISEFIPKIYGLRAGLLYYAQPPVDRQLSSIEPDQSDDLAAAMINYIVARQAAFPVEADVTLRLFGDRPVWEQASELLSRAFGRVGLMARVPILDPLAKRLLRAQRLSVIDGDSDLTHWYTGKSLSEPLIKTEFDERAFSNVELYSYDAIYDLAGLSIAHPSRTWARQLRDHYTRSTDQPIEAERWLLYQLVHLWDGNRRAPSRSTRLQRNYARALQNFFAETYYDDLTLNSSGAICALDVDGVLETETLGFPGLTPKSALALRALIRHGYRPVLATGRSLDEVRERCEAYHLAGGAAEYGAVVYNHETGGVQEILSDDERVDLDRLKSALSSIEGVSIDSDYHYAVRAYQLDPSGRRRGLSSELISIALAESQLQDKVRSIPGESQTDFMAVNIDKAIGLRRLIRDLGATDRMDETRPLALAVGDTSSDLPMFDLAALACAPSHADSRVKKAGIQIMRQPYQAGLALAVARLLKHQPGHCPICRAPDFTPDTELLLSVLAAQETGKIGMIWQALRLGIQVRSRSTD